MMAKRKVCKKKSVRKYVDGWLNGHVVRVRFMPGGGGECRWIRPHPLILIGRDVSWRVVGGVLLHEAFEYVATEYELRFARCDVAELDYSDMNFYMTHAEFTRISDRVGRFMVDVLPELAKLYVEQTGESGWLVTDM